MLRVKVQSYIYNYRKKIQTKGHSTKDPIKVYEYIEIQNLYIIFKLQIDFCPFVLNYSFQMLIDYLFALLDYIY